MPEVVEVDAGPSRATLEDFLEILGRDGSNTNYCCHACHEYYRGKGDSKQWTLKCAPSRALAHIAKKSNEGVRLCVGKYTRSQQEAIKQLWSAYQEQRDGGSRGAGVLFTAHHAQLLQREGGKEGRQDCTHPMPFSTPGHSA